MPIEPEYETNNTAHMSREEIRREVDRTFEEFYNFEQPIAPPISRPINFTARPINNPQNWELGARVTFSATSTTDRGLNLNYHTPSTNWVSPTSTIIDITPPRLTNPFLQINRKARELLKESEDAVDPIYIQIEGRSSASLLENSFSSAFLLAKYLKEKDLFAIIEKMGVGQPDQYVRYIFKTEEQIDPISFMEDIFKGDIG